MTERRLEETAVRKWLDEIIEAKEKMKELAVFDKDVRMNIMPRTIGLYEGIGLVAEALGAELEERHNENLRFQYMYSFRYKDTEVVQLAENRMKQSESSNGEPNTEGGNV